MSIFRVSLVIKSLKNFNCGVHFYKSEKRQLNELSTTHQGERTCAIEDSP